MRGAAVREGCSCSDGPGARNEGGCRGGRLIRGRGCLEGRGGNEEGCRDKELLPGELK